MNHTWSILNLKRVTSTGVVTEVKYQCLSEHDNMVDRQIEKLIITGSTSDEGFIEYDNLTEENVLGWVTSSIDVSSIENTLSSSINNMLEVISQNTSSEGTPW
jgi:hypothetical protein